ncbi:MAG: hypothetical protein EF806_05435 [Candidatus Methanoliparum thermophilum]|uniref:Flagellin n=1 Tax=Methanoliparum thermophilum TaxID=2491083 RepID=A0A520KR31_METT2|nr:hypothetical protein [Candidatus Methanoliparum sp. LAM-1]RZN64064.1 MAG: hypothetical protein EF806_05435 [Candidatus Methanoliparum thermophilum]BDC35680.1 hypothetical protein MTLP_03620 [Candidatus Methanoliparum sp. LAM-1]
MPGNVITTAVLIIVGVTAATLLLTQVMYPALSDINDAVNTLSDKISDNTLTDITPIFTYVTGKNNIHIMLKNTGKADIPFDRLKQSEIYIISRDAEKLSDKNAKTAFIGINHKDMYKNNYWKYSLPARDEDKRTYWKQGETIYIDAFMTRPLEPGEYTVRFVMYNGYTIDDIITISKSRWY